MTLYCNYKKEHILAILDRDYPGYEVISEEKMVQLHSNNPDMIKRVFDTLHYDKLEYVCYMLTPNTFGAIKGMCCNGVRFGEDGDYISLPLLPDRFFSRVK